MPVVRYNKSTAFSLSPSPVSAKSCRICLLTEEIIHFHIFHVIYFKAKLRIYNITAKAALKFGSEAWVLKKREEQHLEAAQIKLLRHLLGITKLDKEKNQCIRGKNRSTEYSKGNKTIPEKVATTRTEDGHK